MDIPMRRFNFLCNFACRAFRACFFVAATFMFSMQAHSTAGALDTTFGVNGVYKSPASLTQSFWTIDSALQSNGKIIVASYCDPFTTKNMCTFRLDPDGSGMDVSFGVGGVATINFGGQEEPRSLAIDALDRILITGVCSGATQPSTGCLLRLTANGAVDGAFGMAGRVNVSGMTELDKVLALPDGRTLVAGRCLSDIYFCVARLLDNGNPDPSFNAGNTQAIFLDNFTGNGSASALALDGAGRIYVTGTCQTGTSFDDKYCVARLTPSGALDTTFNGTGLKIWESPSTHLLSVFSKKSVAVTPSGRVFVSTGCSAGSFFDRTATGSGLCLSALTPQGALDASFSLDTVPGNGFRYVELNGYSGAPSPVDGVGLYVMEFESLLLVGSWQSSGGQDLIRLRANGALDQSFGNGGAIRSLFNNVAGSRFDTYSATRVVNNRLILGGICSGPSERACLSRYDLAPPPGEDCKLDLDDDGKILPQTDGVMWLRIMLGFRGAAVMQGAMGAASDLPNRTTWPQIQSYLFNHCGIR
jgi:uncharacterized delta-60 repeat protein